LENRVGCLSQKVVSTTGRLEKEPGKGMETYATGQGEKNTNHDFAKVSSARERQGHLGETYKDRNLKRKKGRTDTAGNQPKKTAKKSNW